MNAYERELTRREMESFSALVDTAITSDGTSVTISNPNHTSFVFHSQWLWRQDPTGVHPTSGQHMESQARSFGSSKIVGAAIVTSQEALKEKNDAVRPIPSPPEFCRHPVASILASTTEELSSSSKLLRIEWSCSRISYYDWNWLQANSYSTSRLLELKQKTRVTPENTAIRFKVPLQEINFPDLKQEGSNSILQFQLLSSILHDGAVLVVNAPSAATAKHNGSTTPNEQEETVVNLAHLLANAPPSHSQQYGSAFHVKSIPEAHNVAYTSYALAPHQDLAYYESPPGLQLLQCWENETTGGESVLIDVMAAAEAFRKICPDLFQVLCSVPATFMKQRPGSDRIYQRAHFRTESNLIDDPDSPVVSVHWSPPFEGPLQVSPEVVDKYYLARNAFELMVDVSISEDVDTSERFLPSLDESIEHQLRKYAREYTWQQVLKPGQCMIFNNLRLIHGRTAFSGTGTRHLVGCYTNIDDTVNTYNVLFRQSELGRQNQFKKPLLVGNGSLVN